MRKEFNITGNCNEREHYLMNNSKMFEEVMELIERRKYFTINRPRQYGKTTMLFQLSAHLEKTADYFPIKLNFQGVDSLWMESDNLFAQMFINSLIEHFDFENKVIAAFIREEKKEVKDMDTLSVFITRLMYKLDKKVVLLIDEVDASSNYEPFLSFLAMLRKKYLARMESKHRTFYSIVLAGVHDIKNLKFKLHDPEAVQYNSPWNIATDFEVDMTFYPHQIVPMLEEYSKVENVKMDIPLIAEQLYYHTSGYPFLVSKLCKNIAEKVLKTKAKAEQNEWTLADLEESVRLLLKENNTNFDSLIGNLENHPDLYSLVSRIILDGETVPFNQYNPTVYKGILYGIFKRNGRIRIHNRIYEQLIYDYMTSKLITEPVAGAKNHGGYFINDDDSLDMEAVLCKFQSFMKEQRSKKDFEFVEKHWRLIFLAYLKPILNGKGHDFKEVETSEEKRLDIVVTYLQYKYILELKIWRGEKAHGKGLNQLANYLDIHSVEKGFLLIFDDRKNPTWASKTIEHEGKEIFAVWV